MVIVHFHVPAVAAVISTAGAARELCFLVLLDDFIDVLLIHDYISLICIFIVPRRFFRRGEIQILCSVLASSNFDGDSKNPFDNIPCTDDIAST